MKSSRLASKRVLVASALALALTALGAQQARATVMVEIPLEDLIHTADAIVHGTVERVGTRLQVREGRAEPHTITVVRVREWLAGDAQSELVRIDEIGGVVGEIGARIDGVPEYRRGEEVVLFLRRVGTSYRTLQMVQGHFEVLHGVPGVDDVVQRDLGAVGLVHWENGPMTIEHGGRRVMRLVDFLGYVRDTLAQPTIPGGSTGTTGGAR